ncbi:uncharacterized protein Z518_01260 [Rhinocladiella mackenziei CBS 650.93]|uniref:Rhinocladiella mackenziei CBS 650.93 unplaced genomic scaffold supercont1.1, whole genome shotgun sequence n=1 Tax=Rhinocladiella mackenziei CBS 650.93 TaxID=1442369 RepID=A0A0D2IVV7_9EURO|nr:uncharacterized protein Z518_01260 [Rhinocladiella mackenziei CBS 650.93]KIX10179.1 hypothetical protein Z518_01260 [Rhinocladiella mackenziei CBS 650.93]
MDRSLDETIAERQRAQNRGRRAPPPRRRDYNYPRDGVRKSARDDRTNLDNDWVHDRYDDEPDNRRGYDRPRERRDRRGDDRSPGPERPPPAKLRVDNLHYDLTEDDIWDLFTRIGPVMDARLRYDRAGRSEGIAFVTYEHVADARAAIRDFDGANAKGQPIRLTLLPLPRRDNPFDRVENPRSLFDRIEAPAGRSRRRSDSPMEEVEEDRVSRRAPRRGQPRERRSDVTKPPPDNIDRYVPGQGDSRSSSHRGGRRPGERRERAARDAEGHKLVNGRPRKTAEELDAEMDDYWGNAGNNAQGEGGNNTAPAGQDRQAEGADDIDMIE